MCLSGPGVYRVYRIFSQMLGQTLIDFPHFEQKKIYPIPTGPGRAARKHGLILSFTCRTTAILKKPRGGRRLDLCWKPLPSRQSSTSGEGLWTWPPGPVESDEMILCTALLLKCQAWRAGPHARAWHFPPVCWAARKQTRTVRTCVGQVAGELAVKNLLLGL